MDVAVTEFKKHLAKYLDRAQKGETICVTDRGHPKAVLGPAVVAEDPIQRGIREGWITPGNGEPPQKVTRRFAPVPGTEGALDEDRGE